MKRLQLLWHVSLRNMAL